MYKVFVNDRPIIFTSSLLKNEAFPVLNCKDITLPEIINKVKTGNIKGCYLFTENLEETWKEFCAEYKMIHAGGGLVVNNKNEVLFIFRVNKWDLPKGRSELNEHISETAIREVQEECNIHQIEIVQFLLTTYHLYPYKKSHRLKKTFWYHMKTMSNEIPKPLLKEGITKAVFLSPSKINTVLKNTYINIKTVYSHYLSLNN